MKYNRLITLLIFAFAATVLPAAAQSQQIQSQSAQNKQSAAQLPMGYGGIQLGMTVEEVKAALIKNPQFGYRGDRDVSLLPGNDRILIETDTTRTFPNSYLSQCYFQFYNEKLYIITINVKPSKMDYHSIFSTLCNKYGNPDSMNPQKSQWQNDSVIMVLEKPLTLKYTDCVVFNQLMEESNVQESIEEMTRSHFLEGL